MDDEARLPRQAGFLFVLPDEPRQQFRDDQIQPLQPSSAMMITKGGCYALDNLGSRPCSALCGIRFMARDQEPFQDWIPVATRAVGQVWLLDNLDNCLHRDDLGRPDRAQNLKP
jgi:hypothetical protein